MQEHIEQARHNESFLKFLTDNAPDKFFDWKITITFYISLHLLRAYGKKLKINIPAGHGFLTYAVQNQVKSNGLGCSKQVIKAYEDLINFSFSMRYDGFLHAKSFNDFSKMQFEAALSDLDIIKDFLREKGLPFEKKEKE